MKLHEAKTAIGDDLAMRDDDFYSIWVGTLQDEQAQYAAMVIAEIDALTVEQAADRFCENNALCEPRASLGFVPPLGFEEE